MTYEEELKKKVKEVKRLRHDYLVFQADANKTRALYNRALAELMEL